LELADHGKNTMRVHEDSSGPTRLLVAVRRGEDGALVAEVNLLQGRFVHPSAHLLQPTPR
jgi:hypothetical protein